MPRKAMLYTCKEIANACILKWEKLSRATPKELIEFSVDESAVPTLSERLHDRLKNWLVELGEQVKDSRGNPKYSSYSGDSQPIDIRFGMKHVEYQPDVVWKNTVNYF